MIVFLFQAPHLEHMLSNVKQNDMNRVPLRELSVIVFRATLDKFIPGKQGNYAYTDLFDQAIGWR